MADQTVPAVPLTLVIPSDILVDIEAIAAICVRSRSWVIIRALKTYIASEGREIKSIAHSAQEIDMGMAIDLDEVISQVERISQGRKP
nr:CopG family transcriptional regulator [uncultured Gellertiella sp.]